MSWVGLSFYSTITFAAVIAAFLFGFMQFGAADDAARGGLAFGIASAAAWAIGSFGGPTRWNNGSNTSAAFFAAISLGMLAPADQVCARSTGFVHVACSLRTASTHSVP